MTDLGMADGVVLGVDLGTTATKVVAVDRSGTLLSVVERRYPLRVGQHGEAEQDPVQVLDAALDGVREVALRHAGRVRGLSFSAALHTLLALSADGRPLSPALSWADTRSASTARRLRPRADLHQATGTPIHPMSPMVKLAWFAEHEPTLHRSAVHWCGLKDFVVREFTGRLVTEHSSASATGLLELRSLCWHAPALAAAGLTEDRLPELVAPTAILQLGRRAARLTGLPEGLPVVAGGGDGPLANLGVGAVLPGMAALSVGTSGALRVIREEPGVDTDGRVFCYALADGLWVLGGAVSNGGVVAQWAAESFGVPVADLLAEAADADVGGLVALPYLLGERAPWWDPDVQGALLGLRRGHGRAEITRAMVEGVGQQLALVLDAVLATGAAVDSVCATGGAFRAPLWSQVLAAALDRPLRIAEGTEGSGRGAALLGWRALGEFTSLREVAGLVEVRQVIHPDPATAVRLSAARPLIVKAHQALRALVRST